MAGTITIRTGLAVTANGATATKAQSVQTITITGDHFIHNVQEIGTSAEAILKGEVGTVGWMYAHNLDATNFVEIGYDDTGFKNVIKLEPGEEQIFRLGQNTPQAKADTGACDMEYVMCED